MVSGLHRLDTSIPQASHAKNLIGLALFRQHLPLTLAHFLTMWKRYWVAQTVFRGPSGRLRVVLLPFCEYSPNCAPQTHIAHELNSSETTNRLSRKAYAQAPADFLSFIRVLSIRCVANTIVMAIEGDQMVIDGSDFDVEDADFVTSSVSKPIGLNSTMSSSPALQTFRELQLTSQCSLRWMGRGMTGHGESLTALWSAHTRHDVAFPDQTKVHKTEVFCASFS